MIRSFKIFWLNRKLMKLNIELVTTEENLYELEDFYRNSRCSRDDWIQVILQLRRDLVKLRKKRDELKTKIYEYEKLSHH